MSRPLFLLALICIGLISCNTLPEAGVEQLATEEFNLSEEVANPLSGTRWQLTNMTDFNDELKNLPDKLVPVLTFSEETFAFMTDCNNPGGGYTLDEGVITVTIYKSTTMLCTDRLGSDGSAIESRIAEVGTTLGAYSIEGDELQLSYDGGQMTLTRLP